MKENLKQLLESGQPLSDYQAASAYWVSPDGEQVLAATGDSHVDIAYCVLAELGCPERSMSKVYVEMFARGYVRVTEDAESIYTDTGSSEKLNLAQKRALILRAFDTNKDLVNAHGRKVEETTVQKFLRRHA